MGITLSQSEEKKPGTRTGRPNYARELRERLAAAACEPGVSVAKLARENGINANMLFTWRRKYLAEQQAQSGRAGKRHASGGRRIISGRSSSAGHEACSNCRHDRDPDRSRSGQGERP